MSTHLKNIDILINDNNHNTQKVLGNSIYRRISLIKHFSRPTYPIIRHLHSACTSLWEYPKYLFTMKLHNFIAAD